MDECHSGLNWVANICKSILFYNFDVIREQNILLPSYKLIEVKTHIREIHFKRLSSNGQEPCTDDCDGPLK